MKKIDYFVPGVSAKALAEVNGGEYPFIPDKLCRPKEDIEFNDELYFLMCDAYPFKKKEIKGLGPRYSICCMAGLIKKGFIVLDEEEFNNYFFEEELA